MRSLAPGKSPVRSKNVVRHKTAKNRPEIGGDLGLPLHLCPFARSLSARSGRNHVATKCGRGRRSRWCAIIKDEEVVGVDRCQARPGEREAALKMELCLGLVAQRVVSDALPTLRPNGAGRLLGSLLR